MSGSGIIGDEYEPSSMWIVSQRSGHRWIPGALDAAAVASRSRSARSAVMTPQPRVIARMIRSASTTSWVVARNTGHPESGVWVSCPPHPESR